MTQPSLHYPHWHGAAFGLGAACLFALMGAMIKHASAFVSTETVVFARSLGGLLVLTPWLLRRGWSGIRTNRPLAHLIRSLCGVGAMFCFFYLLGQLPLATAVLLTFTAPLFVPWLAKLFLNEPLSRRLLATVVVGFLGVVLALKPASGLFTPMALIGVLGGLLAATSMISMRTLAQTEPPSRVVFYYTLCGTVVSLPGIWMNQDIPESMGLLMLLAIAAIATVAQLLAVKGYAVASASRMGLYTFAAIGFSILLGWAIWHETPDTTALAGMGLVLFAVLSARDAQHPSSGYNRASIHPSVKSS